MTVSELRRRMSQREFIEWAIYLTLQDRGEPGVVRSSYRLQREEPDVEISGAALIAAMKRDHRRAR